MSIVTVYIPSPYNVFLYFLEGQVHKDSKLGIMTNMGKSRLAKVIFSSGKWSDPGHFLKAQGKFFFSFPCTPFLHIF